MNDLARAIDVIIRGKSLIRNKFEVYNLNSFNCKIETIAMEIASNVGVPLLFTKQYSDTAGFSINSRKFSKTFFFQFNDSIKSVLDVLLDSFPQSVMSQGVHNNDIINQRGNSEPSFCQVCGNHHMQEVLDLHEQPLANSFAVSIEESLKRDKYPLKLMRCPNCNHVQLSHVVDRQKIFQSYMYQSNSSTTSLQYFEWLAAKIIGESNINDSQSGTVLEIACNDGSQLDFFRQRGWKTFGVDPARNLITTARKKGHFIIEGFWGSEMFDWSQLPKSSEIDAIVALNVLAHVEKPVKFLRDCARVMGPQTKLYVQTSQCEMMNEGQFDTAYHEHISFFSAHSFVEAALLAGLNITHFEETPVHGISCLVTLKLPFKSKSPYPYGSSVLNRLKLEEALGIDKEIFYSRFESKAHNLKRWIKHHLQKFIESGHDIGGFGAAAKGIVMLHYTKKSSAFSFVIDDSPLKNNLFCPGTSIPIHNSSYLSTLAKSRKPLVLVIFAWNLWSEISNKIRSIFQGSGKRVTCLVPFPIPSVVTLGDCKESCYHTLATAPPNPFKISKSLPTTVVAIVSFRNAMVLLPHWIRHHSSVFDIVIFVDTGSTDMSLVEIRRLAPSTWRVVNSEKREMETMNIPTVHDELQLITDSYSNVWIMRLDVTEFLVSTRLHHSVSQIMLDEPGAESLNVARYSAFPRNNLSLELYDVPLVQKHSTVAIFPQDSQRLNQVSTKNATLLEGASIMPSVVPLHSHSSGPFHESMGPSWSCDNYNPLHNAKEMTILHDAFIIDYRWQPFVVGSGDIYCPLAAVLDAKVRADNNLCSQFPAGKLTRVDLSDIYSSQSLTFFKGHLMNIFKTLQDFIFTTHTG